MHGSRRVLALAEGDAGAGQIIRGHFHGHPVAQQNADVVLAHLAGEICQHFVAVFEPTRNCVPGNASTTTPSARILSSSFAILPLSIHHPG